jgi:hypothetical protein
MTVSFVSSSPPELVGRDGCSACGDAVRCGDGCDTGPDGFACGEYGRNALGSDTDRT